MEVGRTTEIFGNRRITARPLFKRTLTGWGRKGEDRREGPRDEPSVDKIWERHF